MPALQKNTRCNPFCDYVSYVSQLKRLAEESSCAVEWNNRVDDALNDQANVELRQVVPLDTRRKFGTFFTGTDLSSKLIECSTGFDPQSVFYDPTCGMGDLLIAAARKLSLYKSLPRTLRQWGKQLTGTDLHPEFIEGAKTRLILLARQRHKTEELLEGSDVDFFPNIRVADGFKQKELFNQATHLLLNPPFGKVASPAGCKWSGGRITEAALFVDAALEYSRPGTEILAILPEVLRSGSFSEQWRRHVNRQARIQLVLPYGVFDDTTDVDVFLLHLTRSCEHTPSFTTWTKTVVSSKPIVADFFDVHVGRVVPHRDKEAGPFRRYIHPRNISVWTEVIRIADKRRHEGLSFKPPFVVLRRTSRPGHSYRAAATIILGTKPVAVENHLIVCKPRDNSIDTCRALMAQLHTHCVNDFLDQRIRCRHLTVGAVAAIPFEPL
ncbi:MAG TPA: N-6 DNA methylase [Kiritimatiellia bacterium]|nr:N-6 DNA methylase [Kiritimatiellia bacterium]HPS08566.1 N-6 DNA methylase [Kiritimatiellia bacterium]